jgi:hypothetical protein
MATPPNRDSEVVHDFRLSHSLDRLFSAKAQNLFLVKPSYWWKP